MKIGFVLLVVCLGLAGCQGQEGSVAVVSENEAGRVAVHTAVVIEPAPDASATPFGPSGEPFTGLPLASPFPSPTSPFPATPTAAVTLTPTPKRCTETRGQIEQHEVAFSPGPYPYVFRVYLPPCFQRDGEARYPVLYIIHGQTYKDDQWDRMGIDETADELILAGKLPPFLIVMPLERNTFADIYETNFGTDLVNALVPWIDTFYPTCAERTCRAIGGLSRGGAWALRLGFTRWDLFGAIGLHSTPPFIGDPNQFPGWLSQIPPDSIPRVYMDIGQYDPYRRSNIEFENILVKYRVPHEWYSFNGNHDEQYWSSHMVDYLTWYAQEWDVLP